MTTPELIAFLILGAVSAAGLILSALCLARQSSQKANDDLARELDRVQNDVAHRLADVQNVLCRMMSENTRTSADIQSKRLAEMNETLQSSMRTLTETTERRLETIRGTMEQKMQSMQTENSKKLDEMRGVVDEKLQKTLDDRMSQSFKLVSDRLESVYKELGEMQNLATGVGDLKKMLSNVKTRGILGEVQLERILSEMLTPAQYDVNVCTKANSDDPVEFAVKLPSKDDSQAYLYLPIDAKFPLDRYNALLDAYETGDPDTVDKASREFETFLRDSAKKINAKYIDPPRTTPFAMLFLPTEGLYAEVARRPELFESLQHDYNVTVTGPSTVTAFLNSLQMGFRTLAIEKRSGEVWQLLGAVKTEFGKFEDVLSSVRKRINGVDADLDKLIGTRTNTILRKLGKVQELPAVEAEQLLSDEPTPDEDEEE